MVKKQKGVIKQNKYTGDMSFDDVSFKDIINEKDIMDMIDDFNTAAIDDVLEDMGIEAEHRDKKATCPECGSDDFIEDSAKGIIVCKCGQVIDDIIENNNERGFFDDEEGTARCSIIHNKLLPQSSLGMSLNITGKLRKLQIWCAMPYKERSNNILYKRIEAVCSINKIPSSVKYDAQLICQKVSNKVHTIGDNIGKPIITRGRNREGIVAGSLYISCRKNGCTRAAKEIADYFGIDESDVNKGVSVIVSILKGDPIIKDIGTSKVIDFIKRKCDELKIKNVDSAKAMIIGRNLDRLGLASNHTTYALAAAAILLMADINKVTYIDKKKLSLYFSGLTDVTIGKTYNQIENKRDILVNDDITLEIVRRKKEKSKNRVITKEIYQKMKMFGVDTSKYIIEGEEPKQQKEKKQKDASDSSDSESDDNNQNDNQNDDRNNNQNNNQNDDRNNNNIILDINEKITDFVEIDQLGPDDICDVINLVKYQIPQLAKIKPTISKEEYAEYKSTIDKYKSMIIEYIMDFPETVNSKEIDSSFFLDSICTQKQKKEILKLL